jgi:hypothetical protein
MGWFDIISLVLKILSEIIQWRTDPNQAKIRAAAVATQDLNNDTESFDKALATNDANLISQHFEQLRDQVAQTTSGANTIGDTLPQTRSDIPPDFSELQKQIEAATKK